MIFFKNTFNQYERNLIRRSIYDISKFKQANITLFNFNILLAAPWHASMWHIVVVLIDEMTLKEGCMYTQNLSSINI